MKKLHGAQTDRHLTIKGLYLFYKKLLENNRILIGGPAHKRLKHWEERV